MAEPDSPLAPAYQTAWACIGVPWLIVAILGVGFHLHPYNGKFGDFSQDWLSARCYIDGAPIYSSMDETVPQYLGVANSTSPDSLRINGHPPTSVLLVLPLGGLSFPLAKLTWNMLSLGAVAASLILICGRRGFAVDRSYYWPIAVLVFGSAPLASQTSMLQFNGILLFLLTAAWWARRNGYGYAAGAILGIAASIKLFPLYMLFVCATLRDGKAVLGGIVAFGLMIGASIGLFGVESWQTFIHDVIPSLAEWRGAWLNSSFTGFWARLFDPGAKAVLNGAPTVVPIVLSPILGRIAILGSSLAVTAVVAWKGWRAHDEAARDRVYAAGVVAMLLCSPTTWDHYWLMLVLPLAIWWWTSLRSFASLVAFYTCVVFLGVVRPIWLWELFVLDPPAFPVHSLTILAYSGYCLLAVWSLLLFGRTADDCTGRET